MTQSGLARFREPERHPGYQQFAIKTARVVGYNWQDHSVDVELNDGSPMQHVPIVSRFAGTDYGEIHAPQYTARTPELAINLGEDGASFPSAVRDSYCIVAFIEGYTTNAICLGFFFPETSQMMISMQMLKRYVGDLFEAVSYDGVRWLSFNKDGTTIAMHTGDPLPPQVNRSDYDKLSVPKTSGHWITLRLANGTKVELNGTSGTIDIRGQGDINVIANGTLFLSGNPLILDGLEGFYL